MKMAAKSTTRTELDSIRFKTPYPLHLTASPIPRALVAGVIDAEKWSDIILFSDDVSQQSQQKQDELRLGVFS